MHSQSVRASAPSTPYAQPKVARAHLSILDVETEICPHALLRVLDLLARNGIMPLTIAAACRDETIGLAVEIEALPPDATATLLARIEAIVTVRTARFS